jgi:hypothetical protein
MQKLTVGSLAEAVSIAERLGMLAANGNVGLQQWRRDSSAFIHRSMLTHVIGNPPMPTLLDLHQD